MPYLAAAFLILISLLVAPASALAQAGVSYRVPTDNPFAGTAGPAPEIYALGLRNPFRFSFDRATGDVLIGDVGQDTREEIDWIGGAAVAVRTSAGPAARGRSRARARAIRPIRARSRIRSSPCSTTPTRAPAPR